MTPSGSLKIQTLVIFILLNLILSSFHLDSWKNDNTTSRILPVVTFFESGTLQIDKYCHLTNDKSHIGDHYYSDKAPLPSLLIIPFFGLCKIIGFISPDNGSYYGRHVYIIGSLICGVVPFVLILLLTLKRIAGSTGFSPWLLGTLPFYSSFLFVFAGTSFNHMLSALFILLAYIFLKDRKYFQAGLFSGLAFLCEYIVAVMIAVWILQILWNEKKLKPLMITGLGLLPSIIMILIYNFMITGNPFTMLYKFHTYQDLHQNYGFSHPSFQSLWGLLFSSYKGMFFYAPVLFLIVFIILKNDYKKSFKDIFKNLLSNYLLIPCFVIILVTSAYFGWWGGWTFGPRLILFVAVLLTYEGIIFLSKQDFSKLAFMLLTGIGIILTFSAKITVLYSVPSEVKFPLTGLILPAMKTNQFNDGNLLTYFFHTPPLIANIAWLILFAVTMIYFAKQKAIPENLNHKGIP